MASRPKISDQTIEKVEKWIDANPEKGITATNKAIEYLIDQQLKEKEHQKEMTREAVEKLIEKKLEEKN